MCKIKIEIPIILITLAMLALLGLSGNLVYKSLSEIVNSILNETKPDQKLLMIKDISSDLNEVENSVKLYSLTGDTPYLKNYYNLNHSLEEKILNLETSVLTDPFSKPLADSLAILARQKLAIWKNILNLHLSKEDEHEAFTQYFEKIDTMMVVRDTIQVQEANKTGFFRRVFGKKPLPPEPIVVDRTAEKQTIQAEMAELEREISTRNKQISARETAFMQKSIEISEEFESLVTHLEIREQQSLVQKTQEADLLASMTYKRLALFALSVLLLLFLVLFLFFRDLRKARAYQRLLREAKTQAEQLARTKEMFAATVSHEMRTPVNAIYGLSEQLLQQYHDPKTQKDLEVIHQSTRHLIDLVNDTFDFTRIENKRLQLKPVDFSLNELLEKVELFNREDALAKNLPFEVNYTNDQVLFGDESRLKQVLNNLVTNAIKFTDQGSVTVKSSYTEKGNAVILNFEVTDTGVGIADENKHAIFEDFVQLETDANKKAGGTGLGLYIVKKLVDLLGGEIQMESEVGKGTTFKLIIPMQKGDSSKIKKISSSLPVPEVLRGKKVLIVDDEEFNRHLLKNILTKWGVEFVEAIDGKQAIDLATTIDFNLVLMDIRMPVLNGSEAARMLKAMAYPARIIALSANTGPSGTDQNERTEFDNFLEKPFDEAALHRVISETLPNEIALPTEGEPETKVNADLRDLENMANGDPVFLKDMIAIFLRSGARSLAGINEAIAVKNWQAAADLAHKLAAPVKHMNVRQVYQTVKSLQEILETAPDPDRVQSKYKQLKKEMKELDSQLRNILDSL